MAPKKAGRYELLEEIGHGAMGVVYRSRDPLIGRTVAIKTLRLDDVGQGKDDAEGLEHFQNEIRAAGRLTHPSIVTIHDAGVDSEAALFYITMEFVQGRSLAKLIEEKQAFPLPRVMRIMEQACRALEYAHQSHIVHRDIKPANILMGELDALKLTDFGTAKILERGGTQSGQIVGTPSYMAPEQVKGRAVDGGADIFALAVILYELTTGERPFPGKNVTTVIYKIVHEDPVPPVRIDSSIHPGLNAVILKGLAKEPGDRYATCADFLSALKTYRESPLSGLGSNVGSNAQTTVRRVPLLPSTRSTIAGQTIPPVRGASPQPESSAQFSRSPGAPQASVATPPGAPRPTAPPATPPAATGPLKTVPMAPDTVRMDPPAAPPVARAAAPAAAQAIPRMRTTLPPKQRSSAGWVVLLLLLLAGGTGAYLRPDVLVDAWHRAAAALGISAPEAPAASPTATPTGGSTSTSGVAPAAATAKTAATSDSAAATRAAKKPSTGTLDLLSVPGGADILINGTSTGRHTPSKLELPAGKYEVTLYLKGYTPFEQGTTIQQGRTIQIEAMLAHR
jgi:eukaryotic-like serine/threonine-protein kinase